MKSNRPLAVDPLDCLRVFCGFRVDRRLPLYVPLIVAAALLASGCSAERDAARKRITPEYDENGKLQLLKYDSKDTGKVDTWSYMDGARVVRIEIDADDDGRIDRWEHYGADQKLEKVGMSRQNDGREDAWSFPGPEGPGSSVARIEISTRRDGTIDRIEYYELDAIVRATEDTDADGRVDKWETYGDGRLTSVAFDTARRGVPDRRLTYGPGGDAKMEIDLQGDGRLLAK
jgi:hypothetical protein